MEHERQRLRKNDLSVLITYIRSSIEILMEYKSDKSHDQNDHNHNMSSLNVSVDDMKIPYDKQMQRQVSEYEQIIQKLEGDVRNHIRIEQQLKLHIESAESKFEENMKTKCKRYVEQID